LVSSEKSGARCLAHVQALVPLHLSRVASATFLVPFHFEFSVLEL
jgi:hypothetical protein